ncbi:MAG: FtsQ-type POTRA domain-containing protein [Oscillospiraceae bacterium]|nr:FtsQ-type POTRA domain-containing protein [Oscillospiraceae bacterium]
MDKKQTPRKRNHYTHAQKTGAKRPSDAVYSANGKFIQYPGTQSAATTARKRNLKRPQTREEMQRKSRKTIRRQRNRYRLVTFFLVTILLAICLFISLKVLFIVHSVESVGSERYDREEIVAFCAIPMEENIFSIDTEALETALYENFTYVENAKVQRKLPDKILITVTDSIPTYYSENLDGLLSTYTIYSQNFKKLTVQAAAPNGLMGLDCDLSDESIHRIINQMIDILDKNGYAGVTGLQVKSSSDINVIYDGRITVKAGTMLYIEYKMKMAFHVINSELSATDKGVIDCTQAGSAVFKPQY